MENGDDLNFESMCKQYHRLSTTVVDKHCPVIKLKCTANKPPWIDIEYRKNRALRRKYEKQLRRNRTEVCKEMYVNQKQICIDMALAKQTEHYSKVVTDAGSCQKSLFKIANNLLDKTKVKILPTYTDPKQFANQFNKF